MQHHVDRFYAAVAVLAGDGHIKQRLISAYSDNIDSISEEDIPVPLKDAFLELKHDLHRETPMSGEDSVCATVRKMSVTEASQCAGKVLTLFAALLSIKDPVEEVLPMADDQEPAPPFLIRTAGRA